VNCALLLGTLDVTEPDGGGKGAVPHPQALEKLFSMVLDEKQPDSVRIAALSGIARHAKIGMAATARKSTVDKLTGKLKGSSPVATAWMQRSLIHILGDIATHGSESSQPPVAAAALAVLSDKKATEWSRCDAARTVGLLEKSAFTNANTVRGLVAEIARLCVDICSGCGNQELKYTPDALAVDFALLHSALKGAESNRGIVTSTPNDLRSTLNELDAKIGEMYELASNSKVQVDQLRNDLQSKGKALESWLNSKGIGGEQVAGK
jgi:hypothetical protein